MGNKQSADENSVSRRSVLASISAATVGGSGIAAGRSDGGNTVEGVEYTRLSPGQQRAEVLSTVKRSSERRIFKKFFREEYDAHLNPGQAKVVKATVGNGDRDRFVIDVPLSGFNSQKCGNSDRAGVAFTVTASSVTGVSGSVTWFRSKQEGSELSKTELFRLSGSSVQSTSTTVTRQDLKKSSSDVGTASSVECETCKAAYSALAAVGCFFTVSGLCALSAIPTGGGTLTVCGAVLAGVCGAASSGDFLTGYSPEGICSGAAAYGEPADWGFCP